jgi:hypothetical protein
VVFSPTPNFPRRKPNCWADSSEAESSWQSSKWPWESFTLSDMPPHAGLMRQSQFRLSGPLRLERLTNSRRLI